MTKRTRGGVGGRTIFLAGASVLVIGAAMAQGQCLRQTITAVDGRADDRLGSRIDVDGDVFVAGAHQHDLPGAEDAGAAYVYRRSGNEWVLEAKLTAPNPEAEAHFGWAVAVDGNRIVVGADDEDVNLKDDGAAYVYRYTGSSWAFEARLTSDDPTLSAFFGAAVEIDGDTIAVGAIGEDNNQGGVYLFRREGQSWGQEAWVEQPFGGQAGDHFGYSLGLDGDALVVGAWRMENPDRPIDHGTVLYYQRQDVSWNFIQTIEPSSTNNFQNFGISVSLDGDQMAVGAWRDETREPEAGACYMYELVNNQWVESQVVTAFDAQADDRFGVGVSVEGDTLAVGARWVDDVAFNAGSVYVFSKQGDTWFVEDKVLLANGTDHDMFGNDVELSGDWMIASAPQADVLDEMAGAVYGFQLTNCDIDLVVDGTCPGGGPITVSWSGATPGGQVAILYALELGQYRIPNSRPCSGVRLGLGALGLQVVQDTTFSGGSNGSRTLFSTAPARACGAYLQLLDLNRCETSNVAQIN